MSRVWTGNNTTQYLSIPASAGFAMTTNVVMMAILNPAALAGAQVILVIGDTGDSRGYGFDIGGASVLRQNNPAGSGVDGTATTALTTGEWYAVMVSFSSGGNRTYRRYRYATPAAASEVITSTGGLNVPLSTDTGSKIGQWVVPSNATCWNGTIDRILIGQHNGTVPSEAEFTSWARNGFVSSIPTVSVKGYWVLSPSGIATDPEVDTSGAGLNIGGANIVGTTAGAAFVLPDAVTFNQPVPLITGMSRAVHRAAYY